jgi:hypothetical protein
MVQSCDLGTLGQSSIRRRREVMSVKEPLLIWYSASDHRETAPWPASRIGQEISHSENLFEVTSGGISSDLEFYEDRRVRMPPAADSRSCEEVQLAADLSIISTEPPLDCYVLARQHRRGIRKVSIPMRHSTMFRGVVALAATLTMGMATAPMAHAGHGGGSASGASHASVQSSTPSVSHPSGRSLVPFEGKVSSPGNVAKVNRTPAGHDPRRDCQYLAGSYNGLFGLDRC